MRVVEFHQCVLPQKIDDDGSVTREDIDHNRALVSPPKVHLPPGIPGDSHEVDERLIAYLQSADEETSQLQLGYLLDEVAKPIVHRIVQRSERLSVSSRHESYVQDVVAETLLRLLARLRVFKANPNHLAISNFEGLVATITYRTITDQLRARNRQRTNLEKKVRRLFTANSGLSIWRDSQQEVVCGYHIAIHNEALTAQGYPSSFELSNAMSAVRIDSRTKNTAELILLVLKEIQRPIRFKDLVDVIGELTFRQRTPADDLGDGPLIVAADEPVEADKNRRLLDRLFAEIQKLRIEQKKSLLLNMTDSYGYSIEWFAFAGIATEQQLADLLQLSVEEFRQLLDRLPMADKEIAQQLGISAAKVTNIRKAVRDRLARCRAAFLEEENR